MKVRFNQKFFFDSYYLHFCVTNRKILYKMSLFLQIIGFRKISDFIPIFGVYSIFGIFRRNKTFFLGSECYETNSYLIFRHSPFQEMIRLKPGNPGSIYNVLSVGTVPTYNVLFVGTVPTYNHFK